MEIFQFVMRNCWSLQSLVPRANASEMDADESLAAKAAALIHSLARNHGLTDGNTFLGFATLIAFLGTNGRRLTRSNDHADALFGELSSGHQDDSSDIAHRMMLGKAES